MENNMLVELEEGKKKIVMVLEYMMNKDLLDTTGGNMSIKIDDNNYLITPSLASKTKFFKLNTNEIIHIDGNGTIISGEGNVSRETVMHLEAYKVNGKIKSIIHSHSNNSLVFATNGTCMPLKLEFVKKLKSIDVLPHAKAGSIELAGYVKNYIESRCETAPIVSLLKDHGLMVFGNGDLLETLELLERVEKNAWVVLNEKDFSI